MHARTQRTHARTHLVVGKGWRCHSSSSSRAATHNAARSSSTSPSSSDSDDDDDDDESQASSPSFFRFAARLSCFCCALERWETWMEGEGRRDKREGKERRHAKQGRKDDKHKQAPVRQVLTD